MADGDLDLRSFYKQTFALLPTVSKRNLKGIKMLDPPRLSKGRKPQFDAAPITTTDKFAMNCWYAFQRYCRPFSATRGRQDSGMPMEYLESATNLVHSRITSDQITHLTGVLAWNSNELISFEEFRRFCWHLFQERMARDHSAPHDFRSPEASPVKPLVDPFDKLSRKQHYVSTAPIDRSVSQPAMSTTATVFSKSSSAAGLSAIEKDAVCEVLKRENRERREKNEYISYGESIPRYQADLEKRAVLSVCNPKERQHVKWQQTLQRRKERDGKLKARRDGRALSQIIAASVQACDRMTVNNVLKHQDISHYEALAKNWEERRDMEEISMQNVERWRQEVYAARTENIRALKTSKRLAQQLVEDSRRRASDVSVSSGSSFAGSSGYFWEQGDQDSMQRFLVAADTSTVVKVPEDIENRIKNAKREKDYLKAKQEKKEYIENILSSRIKNYSIVKDRNKMLAGLTCEVSISSLEGSDYFAPRAKR